MATAKIVPPAPPLPPPAEVVLTMSHEEAAAVASVLCKVGGDPRRSPRGYTDTVRDALRLIGYAWNIHGTLTNEYYKRVQNNSSLFFEDGDVQ